MSSYLLSASNTMSSDIKDAYKVMEANIHDSDHGVFIPQEYKATKQSISDFVTSISLKIEKQCYLVIEWVKSALTKKVSDANRNPEFFDHTLKNILSVK